jgi:hypothetical protein
MRHIDSDRVISVNHRHFPLGLRVATFTVFGITMASIFAFAFGWLVMLLWNKLMPSIFGFPIVNYWQSVGLVVLAKILFGGFGPHHGVPHKSHRHFKDCFFSCNDEPSFNHADLENTECFHKYWKEEGKKAFESYLEKRASTGENVND